MAATKEISADAAAAALPPELVGLLFVCFFKFVFSFGVTQQRFLKWLKVWQKNKLN